MQLAQVAVRLFAVGGFDRIDGPGRYTTMTLDSHEFIRRLLGFRGRLRRAPE